MTDRRQSEPTERPETVQPGGYCLALFRGTEDESRSPQDPFELKPEQRHKVELRLPKE